MKPLLKLYLKTFLQMGILFGLLMLGWNFLEGDGLHLEQTLFMAFFFGLSSSLIFVTFHRYKLKKKGVQTITSENLGVSQKKTLKSPISKKVLFEKLKSDSKYGEMKLSEYVNEIEIRSGVSWNSWGEKIRIGVDSSEGHQNEFEISIKPKLKTVLVDFGRNFDHLNRIENIIKNAA